jgi:hypothetical protein
MTENAPYSTFNKTLSKCKVFCSGKAIPHTSDDEIRGFIGFLSKFVTTIVRPHANKEFLYIEFSDMSAAHYLVSQHPLVLKNARLNVSAANDDDRKRLT